MGIDIALIVAAWNAALELGLLQMAARPIDAVLCNGGNGAVGRPGCRLGGAELAGYSAAQVKRIWAEVSQAEAKQHGAFVEDALTEADALAAVGQDERQEERA